MRVEIIYPREALIITAHDSTFVFGNYSPRAAQLTVNGLRPRQYANGTFLGMVPVHPGQFVFRAVVRRDSTADSDSAVVLRNVSVPPFLLTSVQMPLTIDTSYIFPRNDLELLPGDLLGVAVKGSPGSTATFAIDGVAQNLPMAEQPARKQFYWGEAVFGRAKPPSTPEVRGIYSGVYRIREADTVVSAAIRFKITNARGEALPVAAPGKLTVRSQRVPRAARLTSELTIGRTAPGKAYQFFLPAGVKLSIDGRDGEYYRAPLVHDETIWIPVANCEWLPLGTTPANSVAQISRTTSFLDRARVTIFLQERVPFKIEQSTKPNRLDLILYGVTADTDWIRHDYGDSLLGEIRWSQERDQKYRLSIELNQKQQWGYRAFFEDTNLILDVKKTPKLPGWPQRPLKDLLICIDPGHGPEEGAIGPSGLYEKDATLMWAGLLKKKLEGRGAYVLMTRSGQEGITLGARVKYADVGNADLLVSMHFNALPDGINPFLNHGTSVYYFHPQSYALADRILKRLLVSLKLPNFGLYYDNLAVCRITSMPSVLIEPAFIMHPAEEDVILAPDMQEKGVNAIVRGLEDFVRAAKD
ncbi:MAG: N-acetylmuramoyl-L-alanine amidase [bacterium]